MKLRPRPLCSHPFASLVFRAMVGLVCLLMAVPHGRSAPAAPTGEKASAPPLVDDGFTRETLMEFENPPEPRPPAPAPVATVDETTVENGSHAVTHHRKHHEGPAADSHPQVVVAKSAHRRNPVESFVYWWNGWVIRNFHTRNGTVLLDSIGAKT